MRLFLLQLILSAIMSDALANTKPLEEGSERLSPWLKRVRLDRVLQYRTLYARQIPKFAYD